MGLLEQIIVIDAMTCKMHFNVWADGHISYSIYYVATRESITHHE